MEYFKGPFDRGDLIEFNCRKGAYDSISAIGLVMNAFYYEYKMRGPIRCDIKMKIITPETNSILDIKNGIFSQTVELESINSWISSALWIIHKSSRNKK